MSPTFVLWTTKGVAAALAKARFHASRTAWLHASHFVGPPYDQSDRLNLVRQDGPADLFTSLPADLIICTKIYPGTRLFPYKSICNAACSSHGRGGWVSLWSYIPTMLIIWRKYGKRRSHKRLECIWAVCRCGDCVGVMEHQDAAVRRTGPAFTELMNFPRGGAVVSALEPPGCRRSSMAQ